jgi:hypothetical protein
LCSLSMPWKHMDWALGLKLRTYWAVEPQMHQRRVIPGAAQQEASQSRCS